MKDTSESIQYQFGSVAANYRTSVVHAQGAEFATMAELAATLGQPRALDVGCGAGHTAVALAPACQEVIAYDLTEAMLAQVNILAKEKGLANVHTKKGDVAQLPFVDGEFDLVTTRYSAHHWLEIKQALAEIHRVLRPGGLFLMCDIVSPEDLAVDTFLQTIEYLRDPSHVRDHRVSEWHTMLAAAGFVVKDLISWPLDIQLDRWTTRMETPTEKVAMLKQLFAEASPAAREGLRLREEGWFSFPAVLIVAGR